MIVEWHRLNQLNAWISVRGWRKEMGQGHSSRALIKTFLNCWTETCLRERRKLPDRMPWCGSTSSFLGPAAPIPTRKPVLPRQFLNTRRKDQVVWRKVNQETADALKQIFKWNFILLHSVVKETFEAHWHLVARCFVRVEQFTTTVNLLIKSFFGCGLGKLAHAEQCLSSQWCFSQNCKATAHTRATAVCLCRHFVCSSVLSHTTLWCCIWNKCPFRILHTIWGAGECLYAKIGDSLLSSTVWHS